MTLKMILLNAINVYRKNFSKLFVPLLIMQLAMLLPLMFFTMPGTVNVARALLVTFSSYSQTGQGVSGVVYVVVFILLILLFLSPLIVSNTVYVIDKDYDNERVSLKQSLGFGKKNYFKMLKSYFAVIAMAMPVFFVVWLMLYGMFVNGFDIMALTVLDIFFIVVSVILVLLFVLGTVFVPYIIVREKRSGFSAAWLSFKYVYKGNFLNTLGRLAFAGAIVLGLVLIINWLSQLPFGELFDLYLRDPLLALQEPLMLFAIVLSIIAIFLVAFIMPFWYAFSYNTYRGVLLDLERKNKSGWEEDNDIIF
ncbi:hypothetical protein LJC56_00060 [Christensenellaceae bacterium OttesenSCG-928-K19]|nr:hypothetical protein [Christensenellaceae bacterium OttesenSCG-928-K19]